MEEDLDSELLLVRSGGIVLMNELSVLIELPYKQTMLQFTLDSVHVAFTDGTTVKSSYRWKRWMNKAVLYFTRSYTHSELAYRFVSIDGRKEVWVACAIYAGERLQFEFGTTKYSGPMWRTFHLDLTSEQRYRLFSYCVEDVARPIGFNQFVYVNFFLPSWLKRDRQLHKVWCSEYIAARLRDIGLKGFENIKPYTVDPLELFEMMRESIFTATVNPIVMNDVIGRGLRLPVDYD